MQTQRNILIAFLLNISFSVFELIGGIYTGSVAIISDAIHDFGDAVSIGASYFLEKKSKRKPDGRYTYGFARYSVLGAAITNLILLVGSVLVMYNALMRILHPVAIHSDGMILMAVLGAAMNLAAAWFTHGGHSLNEKAVNLHMLEDVLGWVVVLIGAIVIHFTNFVLIDPLMSIFVAVFILIHALRGMGQVMDVFLEKAPSDVDVEELLQHLQNMPRVTDVHHLHVWSMDGVNHYATVHVAVVHCDAVALKDAIRRECREHGISHITIELEEDGEPCQQTACKPEKMQISGHHHHHGNGHGHHHHHH